MAHSTAVAAADSVDLAFYDDACRAVSQANSFDEVKEIRSKAIAIKAYAKQANNKTLEADAFEIRKRAERRLGEMMADSPKAKPRGSNQHKDRVAREPEAPPTLAEAGIDKNLADRARRAHEMPKAEFEAMVAKGRDDVKKSAERAAESKARRKEKHRKIARDAACTLAEKGPFPLMLADPPWRWEHFADEEAESEDGKGRTPDQHYPTMTVDDIMDFVVDGIPVIELAHRNSALLLWCTSSTIDRGIEVMTRWGFEFKSSAAWVKIAGVEMKGLTLVVGKDGAKLQTGMGLVFRNCHEVLLYGTRGDMPGPQWQPPSVIVAPRGKHSSKPEAARAMIEKMYPDFGEKQRIELFARGKVPGWTTYGFEAK